LPTTLLTPRSLIPVDRGAFTFLESLLYPDVETFDLRRLRSGYVPATQNIDS
jgi:hypothetical protein